jgi:uncharacterized membrane protein YhaH (DUF805 family)
VSDLLLTLVATLIVAALTRRSSVLARVMYALGGAAWIITACGYLVRRMHERGWAPEWISMVWLATAGCLILVWRGIGVYVLGKKQEQSPNPKMTQGPQKRPTKGQA